MTLVTVIASLSFGLVASGLVLPVVDADSQDGSRQGLARDSNSRKRVIIRCTGNSCRSQMAEAFWKKHGGDRMIVCRRVRDEIERKVKEWIAGT